MTLSRFLILFFTLLITSSVFAFDGLAYYGTEISPHDRYNAHGQRLTSVRTILRQDRANYYLNNRKDSYDEASKYFADETHRSIFDTATISISPELARQIVSGRSVLITVYVLTPSSIAVKPGLQ